MNLGLYHHPRRPGIEKLLGGSFGPFPALDHFSARYRDPILLQDILGLVLMNFHNDSLLDLWHDLACSLGQRFATLNFIEALPIGQTRRAMRRDFATLISGSRSGAGRSHLGRQTMLLL